MRFIDWFKEDIVRFGGWINWLSSCNLIVVYCSLGFCYVICNMNVLDTVIVLVCCKVFEIFRSTVSVGDDLQLRKKISTWPNCRWIYTSYKIASFVPGLWSITEWRAVSLSTISMFMWWGVVSSSGPLASPSGKEYFQLTIQQTVRIRILQYLPVLTSLS